MCATVKMCVDMIESGDSIFGMVVSYVEIAKCGLCTEGAVRAAVSAKRLDVKSLEGVIGFVLASRTKVLGIGFMDGLFENKSDDDLQKYVAKECGFDKDLAEEQEQMIRIGYIPVEE